MTATRIVVGVDGSEGADAAVRWCARYASALDAAVTALAVIEPTVWLAPPPPPVAEAAQRAFDSERDVVQAHLEHEWCDPLRQAGVRYEARALRGYAADSLMETATEQGADLIVVGRRGRRRVFEALVGSVPRQLAHYAEQPLVIVPMPKPAG